MLENSFQQWARRYAREYGFTVRVRGNWVDLIGHGQEIECMTVDGVMKACAGVKS